MDQLKKSMGLVEFIVLMAMIISLNSLSIDMILPAFPAIRQEYGLEAGDNRTALLVLIFFIGMAVGQIFYGSLADSFGRKKTLYICLSIYLLATLAILLSSHLLSIIGFRFIQGLGAAGFRVLTITIARDRFAGRQMAEVMSWIMMVFILVPMFAPQFGQIIIMFFPWKSIFVSLVLFALIIGLWVWLRLEESLKPAYRKNFTLSNIYKGFRLTLQDRSALGYTLVAAFIFGCLTVFLSSAENIYKQIFDIEGLHFTLLFAMVAMFAGIGNFFNSRLVRRFGMRRLSQLGMMGYLSLSIFWMISTFIFKGYPPLWLFLLLFSLLMFCQPLIFANANAMSMENMGENAGAAASVIGFLSTLGAAILGSIIGYFFQKIGNLIPITIGFVAYSAMAFFCMLYTENFKFFQPSHEEKL